MQASQRPDREHRNCETRQDPPFHLLSPLDRGTGARPRRARDLGDSRQHRLGDRHVSGLRQMIQIDINGLCPVVKKRGQIDGVRGLDQIRDDDDARRLSLRKEAVGARDRSCSRRPSAARPAF